MREKLGKLMLKHGMGGQVFGGDLTDDILQLMCNEVVKAYMVKYEDFIHLFESAEKFWELYTDALLLDYKDQYTESTIKTAIENYKKETK